MSDLISVIIPCYNQAQFLGQAIESVLYQTYTQFEIIVVNDGSTDDTSEVAARYSNVRCISQKNQGVAAARNAGLRESKGNYLIFLDADDRLLPNALEIGLKFLNKYPECAFVYGHVNLIASEGTPLQTPQQSCVARDHYIEMLRHNYIWNTSVVMYKRTIFESVGGFNTSLSPSDEYEMHLRIIRDFPIYCHNFVVAEYRLHSLNITRNLALMLKAAISARRSHRKYVKGKRELVEAHKSGIKVIQNDYGEQLINKIRAYMHPLEWNKIMQDVLILMRYYPHGFIRLICPKFLYRLYMFFKHLLIRVNLLMRAKNSSAASSVYEGFHDVANFNVISGWAWDMKKPDLPIYVDIYAGSNLLATVKANKFRRDLLEAGKGNGYHAFNYIIPRWLRNGKPHLIRVRVVGTDFDLNLTPKEIKYSLVNSGLWSRTADTKYNAELQYWKSRHKIEHGRFKNSHYQKLMLAIAGESDPAFLEDKIVADFGCGPRGSLAWAHNAKTKIGIDVLVDRYLDEFKQDLVAHGMIYVKCTEVAIPLPSCSVDVLFTLNAMDHIDNFSAICSEILRIIKPNGELIGSFNIGEPPTLTEPLCLTEELIKTHLLSNMDVVSYRIARQGPEDNCYKYLLEEELEYEPGERGYLWLRARKR